MVSSSCSDYEETIENSATARFLPLPRSTERPTSVVSTEKIAAQTETADEALLANICGGDRDALALLFRRYAHPVRNVGQRILRDKAEADDLVQEVFLYIHRKSTLFDSSKGPARSWIIQVAYTQALLRRRHLKAQGFYLSGIADKAVEDRQPEANGGADYDRTVEGLFGRDGWKKIIEELTEDQ